MTRRSEGGQRESNYIMAHKMAMVLFPYMVTTFFSELITCIVHTDTIAYSIIAYSIILWVPKRHTQCIPFRRPKQGTVRRCCLQTRGRISQEETHWQMRMAPRQSHVHKGPPVECEGNSQDTLLLE